MSVFLHTKQFSKHHLDVLQFNSILTHLSGDSIRVYELRAQCHKTTLHFRCHLKTQIVTCASDRLAINQRFPRFPPSLGSVNLLEWLTELRETFYLSDYHFIIKGSNSGNSGWKRCIRQVMVKSSELACSLWAHSPNLVLLGFYGDLIT